MSEVAQSCLTLCDPMDCILSGFSIHGIFQARVLEWVAISFSRGSSPPRDLTPVSHTVDRGFTIWATREVLLWTFISILWNTIWLCKGINYMHILQHRRTSKTYANERSQIQMTKYCMISLVWMSRNGMSGYRIESQSTLVFSWIWRQELTADWHEKHLYDVSFLDILEIV